jgi:hypothetical protein
MSEESDSKNTGNVNYGINASGDVNIGDVGGQLAFGKNISQSQSSSTVDIEKLKKSLLDLREELTKLDLSSENKDIIKGDVSAALKEAGKDNPKLPTIKSRVESIIETLKDAGVTLENVSKICGSLKIAAGIFGIPL